MRGQGKVSKMKEYLEKIEKYLDEYTSAPHSHYMDKVFEAMRYSLLDAGKRVRPMLTLMFSEVAGGTVEAALPFASAVEMIHTYSLIHDDLPLMDNDDMRRGKPSNHIVYGEDIALLAGDGLLTLAFEACLGEKALLVAGPDKAAKAAYVLSKYSGVCGMVGGQCIDVMSAGKITRENELFEMVSGKTVALLKAACIMGVIAAGGSEKQIKAAEDYAQGLGMAFQIRDDILDVTGDPKLLGKSVGNDEKNDRFNYVSLYGLAGAQILVEQFTDDAIKALDAFEKDTAALKEYALKLINREK